MTKEIPTRRKHVGAALAKEINRLHAELLDAAKISIEKAIRIGKLLTEQKAGVKAEGGLWLKWLQGNVGFSADTARRYMGIYEKREEPALRTVRNLKAAYLLLAGDTKSSPEADLEPVEPLSQPENEARVASVEVITETKDVMVSAISCVHEATVELSAEQAEHTRVSQSGWPTSSRGAVLAFSLEDTLIHLGTQYINSVCKEIDDRADDEEERQRLMAILLNELDRLRKQVQDHFRAPRQ
jgi:hypothetical protein